MGPRYLQTLEHGGRVGDAGHLGPDGGDGPAPNDADVALLETVVGAPDAQEEEGEEDDGADDEQDLELTQRLQRHHRHLRQPVDKGWTLIFVHSTFNIVQVFKLHDADWLILKYYILLDSE